MRPGVWGVAPSRPVRYVVAVACSRSGWLVRAGGRSCRQDIAAPSSSRPHGAPATRRPARSAGLDLLLGHFGTHQAWQCVSCSGLGLSGVGLCQECCGLGWVVPVDFDVSLGLQEPLEPLEPLPHAPPGVRPV